jgi:hypothetical protein
MTKPLDLHGARFGRIAVIGRDAPRIYAGRSETMWRCRCDCGSEFSASTAILKKGHKRSCGCLSAESRKDRATKHGLHGTRTYVSWISMVNRCTNSKLAIYKRYGGRGITVCDRWREFENFLADMGERPEGMSLDRIDNNGNYDPGNCRWANDRQQSENRRSTRWIEHDGMRLSVSEWARRLGVNRATLIEALNKYPVDIALRERTPPYTKRATTIAAQIS